jgi:hypothetical protein
MVVLFRIVVEENIKQHTAISGNIFKNVEEREIDLFSFSLFF